jgi:hypothetical protein
MSKNARPGHPHYSRAPRWTKTEIAAFNHWLRPLGHSDRFALKIGAGHIAVALNTRFPDRYRPFTANAINGRLARINGTKKRYE